MSAQPKWVQLDGEAERRHMEPSYLRYLCRRYSVTLLGTPKRRLVCPEELDAALDRVARGIASNDAERGEIEQTVANLPRLKPR